MIRLLNHSPFGAELYPVYDVSHGIIHVCIIKATWQFSHKGEVQLLDRSHPIVVQDNFYGFPNASSIVAAQDNMACKQYAEVICYGTAYPKPKQVKMSVSLRLSSPQGDWQKSLAVFGERYWVQSAGGLVPSEPDYLNPLPIRYEYAFGGRADKQRYTANPAGIGFNTKFEKALLPQIEYPQALIQCADERPMPAGYGPMPASWLRSKIYEHLPQYHLLGNRISLAPYDQWFKQRFIGKEQVELTGLSPESQLIRFQLPDIAPYLILAQHMQEDTVKPACDTLIIDAEKQIFSLIWRYRILSKVKYKNCLIKINQ